MIYLCKMMKKSKSNFMILKFKILLTTVEPSALSTLQFSPPGGELRLVLLVSWLVGCLIPLSPENGSKDFSDFWHEVWGP
jgi:hypothetical protein